jgi:CspA family cold shock protein
MDRQRGTVKWFSREKGWGFIRLASGDEIFVHHSDIEGEGFVNLEDDEPVEFTIEEMEKGPRARNVRSIGGGGAPTISGAAEADESSGSVKDEPAHAGSRRNADSGRTDSRSGGLRPLAEQLRERLGRHFPGLGG